MNTQGNSKKQLNRKKKVNNSGLFRTLRGLPVEGKHRKKSALPQPFYNSGYLAVCLAAVIAGVSSLGARQLLGVHWQHAFITASVAFVAGSLILFVALEYFIFSEVRALYGLLEHIKKKDFKLVKKTLKSVSPYHPIRKLNNEIATFASSKEREIDHLKELEKYRKEFLADVSHELKTPIFAAQGLIDTLLDGAMDDPAVRDDFLKRAGRNIDSLVALVEDLLMVSQLEAGALRMHFAPVELVPLATDILDAMEPKAAARKVALRLERKGDKATLVYADGGRLRQVLTNLVHNAIKYGNEGGTVTLSFEADKDHVAIMVKDDGPGIPQEHLGRIFERFYRIDKSRSKEGGKDSGGTGLGLAIVKHILEAHHSKISVTSKPGKGSAFQFKLKRIRPGEVLKQTQLGQMPNGGNMPGPSPFNGQPFSLDRAG